LGGLPALVGSGLAPTQPPQKLDRILVCDRLVIDGL
jgi:hypothetical protein